MTLRNLDDRTIAPVWAWKRVVRLDLSHNKLRVLPDLLHLPVLERLDISDNKLQQLPTQLLLPELVHLNLAQNNFATFPTVDSTNLPKLQHLNLSRNKLNRVSVDSIEWLCRSECTLKSLELKGNPQLPLPTSTIIERGGTHVCRFFKDLGQGQRTCWNQTVMVVGQEAAGKTSLCQALLGHSCADQEQAIAISTVGIETVHWRSVVALPNRSVS